MNKEDKFRNLKRPCNPMPDFIQKSLVENKVMGNYKERPAYQQNDYLGWINRAVRQETKMKRLNQMIDELRNGGLYMNMKYKGYFKNAQITPGDSVDQASLLSQGKLES